jgi:hypothetical protein
MEIISVKTQFFNPGLNRFEFTPENHNPNSITINNTNYNLELRSKSLSQEMLKQKRFSEQAKSKVLGK